MRFCAHCGAQVPDNAKFCGACGTSIDAPDNATVTISDSEPPRRHPEKKKGLFHYVWLFLKVLIIAILAVFLIVFLRGVYLGYTTQFAPGQVQEDLSPTRDGWTSPGSRTSGDDGFENLDDLPLQDRAEYWEALLDRSYDDLKQEERKGKAADDARILELVLAIEDLHTQLDQLEQ